MSIDRGGTAPVKLIHLSPYRQAVGIAYVVIAVWYLLWRATALNPDALAFSWLVYAAEVGGCLVGLLHLYLTWAITDRTAPPPRPDMTVDVLVMADTKQAEVVRRTVRAAAELGFPHSTCLVDPWASTELAEVARELHVRYVPGPSSGTSRGRCLNAALQASTAEVVVVFDAHHAPRHDFLVKTLGYFQDAEVAFVQTPEDAYNLDSYEHWLQRKNGVVWSEQSLSQRVVQPGRDRMNAALLGEACCLLRRSSLDAVGGFAEGHIMELRQTSIRLHKKGFRSVYHNESLAFGLAPSDLGTFLQQRVLEARGGLVLWWREGILLAGGLTLPQRLSYLSTVLPALNGLARGLFYILPGIILWTGILPLAADGNDFLLHFLPYFLFGMWAYGESGRGYARWLLAELYEVARFYGLALTLLKRPETDDVKGVTLTIPHCLLSALNLSGVGVGLLPLIDLHPPLPPIALWFCCLWAFSIFTLSAWVMESVEKPRRRAEYRFPIPLPVRLSAIADTPPTVGTVDDVSTSGMKIHARFQGNVTRGTVLHGDLFVPGGAVGFSATVVSLFNARAGGSEYLKSIGCKVDWDSPEGHDRIERLLYGSDLQLRIMELSETGGTFLDNVKGLFEGKNTTPNSWRLWAPVYYPGAGGSPDVGLISNGDASGRSRHLLLFSPAPYNTTLEVRMVTRTGETVLSCHPRMETRIETALSPIYLYDLEPAGGVETPLEPATAARL